MATLNTEVIIVNDRSSYEICIQDVTEMAVQSMSDSWF